MKQLVVILDSLFKHYLQQHYGLSKSFEPLKSLIDKQAFFTVGMKVEKLSGDLRLALDIMQKTVRQKLHEL